MDVKRAVLLVVTGAVVAAACDRSRAIEPPEPNDGVPVVGPTRDELANAPTINLTEVARIDGNDHRIPLSFVSSIALSKRQEVYALDRQGSRVVVYDSLGTGLRVIGGSGDGPGELRNPAHLALTADTLFVIDEHGLNRFLTDGTYLGRLPVTNPTDYQGPANALLFPQSLHTTDMGLVVSFRSNLGGDRRRTRRITMTLHVLDSRTGIPGPTIAISESPDLHPLNGSGAAYAWFAARQSYAVAPNGLIFLTNTDGRDIDVVPLRSDSTWRIRFDAPRRLVQSADLSAIQESTFELLGTIGLDPAAQAERELAMLSLPHYKYWPAVGRLLAASPNEVLVERPDLSDSYGGLDALPTTWDLITAQGGIVGRLQLPGRLTPMVMTENTLVALSRDRFDVPSIVRYRVLRRGQERD